MWPIKQCDTELLRTRHDFMSDSKLSALKFDVASVSVQSFTCNLLLLLVTMLRFSLRLLVTFSEVD